MMKKSHRGDMTEGVIRTPLLLSRSKLSNNEAISLKPLSNQQKV